MDEETITIIDFSRMIGVTREAVTKAIKSGRLANSIVKGSRGQYPRLYPEIAKQEWAANTSPSKGGNFRSDGPRRAIEPTQQVEDDESEPTAASYAKSRAKREAYEAELARLKVQKELGQLVDADEVKQAAFKVARQVRDGLLNIPDRIAAELAAESDTFAVHRLLTEEIRKVLQDVSIGVSDG